MKDGYFAKILPYLIILCFYWVVYFVFDFNGLYGQDGHSYFKYSKKISLYFSQGIHPEDYYWPIYYPLLGAVASLFAMENLRALQLISVISFCGIIFYIKNILKLLTTDKKEVIDIYLSLCLCLAPYMLRQSVFVMSDMCAFFFMIATVYYIFKYQESTNLKNCIKLSILGCLAVLTRYQMGILLFFPLLYFLVKIIKQKKYFHLLISLLFSLLLLLPHIWLKKETASSFMGNTYFNSWSISNFFATSFQTTEGLMSYSYPNVLYVCHIFFHPGFLLLGIVIILFFKRKDVSTTPQIVLAASLCLYLFFLSGIAFQNSRVLSAAFPLVILLFYPAYTRLLDKIRSFMPLISVSILLLPIFLIQIFLNAYVINKFFKKQQVQVSVCEVVNSYYPDYQTVITLGIEGALASYTNFKVVQIWKKDIIQINPKTLLLMNKAYIDGQFKSTEIDKRTTNIYDNFQTTKLKDLAGGWVLYDIQ